MKGESSVPLENMEKSFIGNSNNKVRIINLYFEAVQKRYDFEIDEILAPSLGEFCIAETARGLEMGKVYTKAVYVDPDSITVPLKKVIRIAVDKDIERYHDLKIEAVKASYILKNKIKKFNLNMKSIETEFTFDRKKLIFYFASEDRVDFRELVKEVRAVRAQSVVCPSALPEANVPELLEKIIKEKAYKQDYDSLTTQLLEENVPYDTVIAALKEVAESSLFENN